MYSLSEREKESAANLLKKLKAADFSCFQAGQYHRQYLHRLQTNLDFYFSIYERMFGILLENENKQAGSRSGKNLIDYGGGCGFLSLYAHYVLGFSQILYVDINPLSAEICKKLFQFISCPPPQICVGDHNSLEKWAKEEAFSAQYLVSSDVIEHIYDLDPFFQTLTKLFPHLEMIFGTGSNPKNPRVCQKLRKYMLDDELRGNDIEPAFLSMRQDYIRSKYSVSSYETLQLAIASRGLVFSDIDSMLEKYLQTKEFPKERKDKYESCNPQTGSWTERILPFSAYKHLADVYGLELCFYSGSYNIYSRSGAAAVFIKYLNQILAHSGDLAFYFSPYLYIRYGSKR